MILLACLPIGTAAHAQDREEDASRSGGDITRPLQRVDLRTEFSREGDEHSQTFTLRYVRPFVFGDGWMGNMRVDFPSKRVVSGEDGADFGFGDILLQAVVVRQLPDRGFGLGAQLIAPTASGRAYGRGQWRLRPTVGYRWSLPRISEDSFFQAVVRYDFSIASEAGRGETRELQVAPNLEIGLAGDTYVSFFPSPDIRYNFVSDTFFLPANVEIGKEWGRLVTSLEGGLALVSGDRPPYDWKLELRIGYRF